MSWLSNKSTKNNGEQQRVDKSFIKLEDQTKNFLKRIGPEVNDIEKEFQITEATCNSFADMLVAISNKLSEDHQNSDPVLALPQFNNAIKFLVKKINVFTSALKTEKEFIQEVVKFFKQDLKQESMLMKELNAFSHFLLTLHTKDHETGLEHYANTIHTHVYKGIALEHVQAKKAIDTFNEEEKALEQEIANLKSLEKRAERILNNKKEMNAPALYEDAHYLIQKLRGDEDSLLKKLGNNHTFVRKELHRLRSPFLNLLHTFEALKTAVDSKELVLDEHSLENLEHNIRSMGETMSKINRIFSRSHRANLRNLPRNI